MEKALEARLQTFRDELVSRSIQGTLSTNEKEDLLDLAVKMLKVPYFQWEIDFENYPSTAPKTFAGADCQRELLILAKEGASCGEFKFSAAYSALGKRAGVGPNAFRAGVRNARDSRLLELSRKRSKLNGRPYGKNTYDLSLLIRHLIIHYDMTPETWRIQ